MAGKKQRSPEKKAAYLRRADARKLARKKKREADREKWANDKDYLKKQAEKGYEKINGKWIRTRKVANVEVHNK